MVERKRVSIAVQVILCLIPLLWIYGFYRIEKLIAAIVLGIVVVIIATAIQFLFPFEFGYGLACLLSFLIPIYFLAKWSQEWNDKVSTDSY